MKEIDFDALALVEDEIVHDVVKFSTSFNRKIRQDPPHQLGVPTQYLAMLAAKREDYKKADELARYMRQESDYHFDSLMVLWLKQLMDHAKKDLEMEKYENILRVPELHVWLSLQRLGNDYIDEDLAYL